MDLNLRTLISTLMKKYKTNISTSSAYYFGVIFINFNCRFEIYIYLNIDLRTKIGQSKHLQYYEKRLKGKRLK